MTSFRIASFDEDGNRVDPPLILQQLINRVSQDLQSQNPLTQLVTGGGSNPLPASGALGPNEEGPLPRPRINLQPGQRPRISFPNGDFGAGDEVLLEAQDREFESLEALFRSDGSPENGSSQAVEDLLALLDRVEDNPEALLLADRLLESQTASAARLSELSQLRNDGEVSTARELLEATGSSQSGFGEASPDERRQRLLDAIIGEPNDDPSTEPVLVDVGGVISSATPERAEELGLRTELGEDLLNEVEAVASEYINPLLESGAIGIRTNDGNPTPRITSSQSNVEEVFVRDYSALRSQADFTSALIATLVDPRSFTRTGDRNIDEGEVQRALLNDDQMLFAYIQTQSFKGETAKRVDLLQQVVGFVNDGGRIVPGPIVGLRLVEGDVEGEVLSFGDSRYELVPASRATEEERQLAFTLADQLFDAIRPEISVSRIADEVRDTLNYRLSDG